MKTVKLNNGIFIQKNVFIFHAIFNKLLSNTKKNIGV